MEEKKTTLNSREDRLFTSMIAGMIGVPAALIIACMFLTDKRNAKRSLEMLVEQNKDRTYIDELQENSTCSNLITEVYNLDRIVQEVNLLEKVIRENHINKPCISISDEQKERLYSYTSDDILILIETYKNEKDSTYESQRNKEELEKQIVFLLAERNDYLTENSRRIVLEFGELLLQSTCAQIITKDPASYDKYQLSYKEEKVFYEDATLGKIEINVHALSSYYSLWETIARLEEKEGISHYELTKILSDFKYCIASTPLYKDGRLKDKEWAPTLRGRVK